MIHSPQKQQRKSNCSTGSKNSLIKLFKKCSKLFRLHGHDQCGIAHFIAVVQNHKYIMEEQTSSLSTAKAISEISKKSLLVIQKGVFFSNFCRRGQQWCSGWVIAMTDAQVTSGFNAVKYSPKACREVHSQPRKAGRCRGKACFQSQGVGSESQPCPSLIGQCTLTSLCLIDL